MKKLFCVFFALMLINSFTAQDNFQTEQSRDILMQANVKSIEIYEMPIEQKEIEYRYLVNSFNYNRFGLMISEEKPFEQKTIYEYDEHNNLSEERIYSLIGGQKLFGKIIHVFDSSDTFQEIIKTQSEKGITFITVHDKKQSGPRRNTYLVDKGQASLVENKSYNKKNQIVSEILFIQPKSEKKYTYKNGLLNSISSNINGINIIESFTYTEDKTQIKKSSSKISGLYTSSSDCSDYKYNANGTINRIIINENDKQRKKVFQYNFFQ